MHEIVDDEYPRLMFEFKQFSELTDPETIDPSTPFGAAIKLAHYGKDMWICFYLPTKRSILVSNIYDVTKLIVSSDVPDIVDFNQRSIMSNVCDDLQSGIAPIIRVADFYASEEENDGSDLPLDLELLKNKMLLFKVSKKKDQFGSYIGPSTISRITADHILVSRLVFWSTSPSQRIHSLASGCLSQKFKEFKLLEGNITRSQILNLWRTKVHSTELHVLVIQLSHAKSFDDGSVLVSKIYDATKLIVPNDVPDIVDFNQRSFMSNVYDDWKSGIAPIISVANFYASEEVSTKNKFGFVIPLLIFGEIGFSILAQIAFKKSSARKRDFGATIAKTPFPLQFLDRYKLHISVGDNAGMVRLLCRDKVARELVGKPCDVVDSDQHSILINEYYEAGQGQRIHGWAPGCLSQKFKEFKLLKGNVYEITNFELVEDKSAFKVTKLSHKFIFYKETNMREIVDDEYPRLMFEFKQFSELTDPETIDPSTPFAGYKQPAAEYNHPTTAKKGRTGQKTA
ncbi:DNA ligase [Striga asiatica]|uniref:DNA ligase n=1 Tax=Striga asiatica TaxID=4170 RepID=A0A5A7P9X3_STRAF|nr:DNA ligase [Striga asiatica]